MAGHGASVWEDRAVAGADLGSNCRLGKPQRTSGRSLRLRFDGQAPLQCQHGWSDRGVGFGASTGGIAKTAAGVVRPWCQAVGGREEGAGVEKAGASARVPCRTTQSARQRLLAGGYTREPETPAKWGHSIGKDGAAAVKSAAPSKGARIRRIRTNGIRTEAVGGGSGRARHPVRAPGRAKSGHPGPKWMRIGQ